MHLPPPPDSRELLPPLLACLPTSFLSSRPPPALLPLLSPVLRQRLNYLSSGSNGSDGWLPLLSWDSQRAANLPEAVERMDLEPHPVSGELELNDVRPAKYRRLDQETLHSRLEVEQFDLLPIYVWCEQDEHGGTGAGWKLAELRSLEDEDDGTEWFDSPSAANDAAASRASTLPSRSSHLTVGSAQSYGQAEEEDDDDDYWASYDRTPGRTPALKHSPAPRQQPSVFQTATPPYSRSEMDYYSRYGTEVQPAMDSHDPDEATEGFGESSLNGDSLVHARSIPVEDGHELVLTSHSGEEKAPLDAAIDSALNQSLPAEISMPRPISQSSSNSGVNRLEERAADMSSNYQSDRALLGVKQHISTDIKSLFRLAKTAGMNRREFKRVIRTELEVLSLLDDDDDE